MTVEFTQTLDNDAIVSFKYVIQIRSFSFSLICNADGTLPSVDLVCYGLGSFTESYIARYQLALLIALRMELKVMA